MVVGNFYRYLSIVLPLAAAIVHRVPRLCCCCFSRRRRLPKIYSIIYSLPQLHKIHIVHTIHIHRSLSILPSISSRWLGFSFSFSSFYPFFCVFYFVLCFLFRSTERKNTVSNLELNSGIGGGGKWW